ncbi:MAG: site-specific integrase [Chloroflexi bacterium]|nr:site-specific integrase [Chloroflexota bacterium]
MTTLPEIHITSETTLLPAIRSWEIFLYDQSRSRFTIKAFIGDLNLFNSFFPPDITLGNISMSDINRFLEWLQKERGIPCSPKSLSRRITSIKSFFRWLTQTGRLTIDPAEKVLQKSVISPLPKILTPEEELKIIEAATQQRLSKKDPRSYVLITLLLSSGIKKGECLGLNLNHINLEDPKGPNFFVRYSSSGSRYKERKINLTHDWVEVFPEYLAKYSPTEQVFPWSPRRLEYLLEDLGREAGLDKHLSFDMCRWTSAINDWQSNMDKETLRQKMGVSKIQWREISLKLRQLSGENSPENRSNLTN